MSGREALPSGVLGYYFNRGGLNNQKLALLGLCLKASLEGPRRLILPKLIQFNQKTMSDTPVDLSRYINLEVFRDFLERRGIEVLDLEARGEEGGWDYFHFANNYIQYATLRNELKPEGFVCDFFRCFVPFIRTSDVMGALSKRIFSEYEVKIVVQMRIEKDWEHHVLHRIKGLIGANENALLSGEAIVQKIRNTFREESSAIYATCDEDSLPVSKEDIRRKIDVELGTKVHFKSDMLETAGEYNQLSLLELSMLDFEMAASAPIFVGISRSTFANLVGIERYAQTNVPVRCHYIYNSPGAELRQRTDNGAFESPELAVASDPSTAEYDFQVALVLDAAGKQAEALEKYLSRAENMDGDVDEAYHSAYRAAQIKESLGYAPDDIVGSYLLACKMLPLRAEAAYAGSRYCRNHKLFQQGYSIAIPALILSSVPDDRFVEPWIYEWAFLDEYSVNAYWSGHYKELLDVCLEFLKRGKFPERHRQRIKANARYSLDRLFK